ncbi:MAG: hypothetical protein NTX94_00730 [Caldiserica bacterium]|nr:hypothetical protein [Caldisericota bacterium]
MDEQKEQPTQQPELANLYLETLIARVDTNKYRLIRQLLDTSHELLEEKTDPLREPVDDVLRKSAGRMVAAAARDAADPAFKETEPRR